MTKAKVKTKIKTGTPAPLFQETFIREVRVHYAPTPEPAFAIRSPQDIARFVRSVLIDNSREHLIALYLDGAHRVASFATVSIGTANATTAHPREIFQRAIGAGAVSLVLAHNHPSDSAQPSDDDRRVTQRIQEAGELLGIRLLDHVIVTGAAYYSFQEEGELRAPQVSAFR